MCRGSNAGKFTTHGAVTVDVAVTCRPRPAFLTAASDTSTRVRPYDATGTTDDAKFLVITVSNTRCGAAIDDPESMFIPFKGTYEGLRSSASGSCGCICV